MVKMMDCDGAIALCTVNKEIYNSEICKARLDNCIIFCIDCEKYSDRKEVMFLEVLNRRP